MYESNPYLILFSPKLKSSLKVTDAVGLLDPPRNKAEIQDRWEDVERQKNDKLNNDDYERRHYNSKLADVKAALLDGGEAEREKHIIAARTEMERRFTQSLKNYVSGDSREVLRTDLIRVANGYKRWFNPVNAEGVAKSAGYRVVDKIGPDEIPLPIPKLPSDWPNKDARDAGVIDKRIPEYLTFLGTYEGRNIQDVYEFLNVSRISSLPTLKNALVTMKSGNLYKVAGTSLNSSKVNSTPHLQAACSLFTVLDQVLNTEESIRHWERCWALRQIDLDLRPVFLSKVIDGRVSVDNYLGAVEKCQEKGLAPDEAACVRVFCSGAKMSYAV